MKRLVQLVALLLCAIPASAQCTAPCIAAATAANSGTSATTAALNMTGATLFVGMTTSFNSPATLSFSDSSGNTWQALTRQGTAVSVNDARMFYVCNPTVSATQTFTGTSTNSFVRVYIQGFSGSAASCFDSESGTTTPGVATTVQPGSITPAQAGELFVTGSATGGVTTTAVSIDSSFMITNSDATGTFGTAGGFAWFVNAGSGALNPTWTLTNNTVRGINGIMAAFKMASAITQGQQIGVFMVGP